MTKARHFIPYLYILPAFLFLLAFTYYPAGFAGFRSLFLWNTTNIEPQFAGFVNYARLFRSERFWQVALNTLVYSVVFIVGSMSIALLLATQINKIRRGGTFYKSAFFYPTMIPMAAASMIWMFMYLPDYGLINLHLRMIGIPGYNWLNDRNIALMSVTVVGIWKFTGYYMLLFLAGLSNVSNELYDAADIEGANAYHKFTKVTFPLISSYTFFIFIIAIINALEAVDQIYIMTQGGPSNSTNLIVYYIYQNAFRFWEMGLASALTTLLVLSLVTVIGIIFVYVGRKVYYEV